jgi:hypothetical protein
MSATAMTAARRSTHPLVSVYGNPPISVATVGSTATVHRRPAQTVLVGWVRAGEPESGSAGSFLNTLLPYYADLRTDVNCCRPAQTAVSLQTLGRA